MVGYKDVVLKHLYKRLQLYISDCSSPESDDFGSGVGQIGMLDRFAGATHAQLDFVEALAVHAIDLRLGDERILVD